MVITGFRGRPRVVVIRCMPNQGHSSALSVHSTPFFFAILNPGLTVFGAAQILRNITFMLLISILEIEFHAQKKNRPNHALIAVYKYCDKWIVSCDTVQFCEHQPQDKFPLFP